MNSRSLHERILCLQPQSTPLWVFQVPSRYRTGCQAWALKSSFLVWRMQDWWRSFFLFYLSIKEGSNSDQGLPVEKKRPQKPEEGESGIASASGCYVHSPLTLWSCSLTFMRKIGASITLSVCCRVSHKEMVLPCPPRTTASGLKGVCGNFPSDQGSTLTFTKKKAKIWTVCQVEVRTCQSSRFFWGRGKALVIDKGETTSMLVLSLWKASSGQSSVLPRRS